MNGRDFHPVIVPPAMMEDIQAAAASGKISAATASGFVANQPIPTSAVAYDPGTFTRENLDEAARMLAGVPPVPMLVSSNLLSRSAATQFQDQGRDYLGAHPSFWAKLPSDAHPTTLCSIPIIDIDVDLAARAEFFAAMGRVCGAA
jgi:hypothetical protein